MEKTAANMVAAATTHAYQAQVQQGSMNLADQTITHSLHQTQEERTPSTAPPTRRRRRPPLVKKTIGKSSMRTNGASSRARKMCLIKNSPQRITAQTIQNTNTRATTSRQIPPRQQTPSDPPSGTAKRPPVVPTTIIR